MNYKKGIEKYCNSECDGGVSLNCVCRKDKLKVMEWIEVDELVKKANYYCIEPDEEKLIEIAEEINQTINEIINKTIELSEGGDDSDMGIIE